MIQESHKGANIMGSAVCLFPSTGVPVEPPRFFSTFPKSDTIPSRQFTATSDEVTPKGTRSVVRESYPKLP